MPKRRLKVIPEPAPGTRSVFVQPPEKAKFPFMRGQGAFDLLCGSCDSILAKNIVDGQVRGVVFKCPDCGSFNDTE
jgi:hypothetical protein